MTTNFSLQEAPDSTFKIDANLITGAIKLYQDDILLEKSKSNRQTFVGKDEKGDELEIKVTTRFPDFMPQVKVNGKVIELVPKQKIHEILISIIPIILFAGGALGGFIGALAIYINFYIFRTKKPLSLAILLVILQTIIAFGVYYIIASTLLSLLK